MKRKEDARFIRGQGKYLDDIVCRGCSTAPSCAAPTRTPHRLDRRLAALAHPKVLG